MNAQYTVVKFSPVPEQTEYVNVALIFSDPRFGLVYDSKFPKLTCVAPYFDTEFLIEYMSAVMRTTGARDLAQAMGEVHRASAQFMLTPARDLAMPLTPEVVQTLKRTYLARTPHGHKTESTTARKRIEGKLDLVLGRFGGPDRSWIMRRPRPQEYLGEEVRARLVDEKFRISRVIKAPKQLIAFDGIDLTWDANAVERRALHVSFAFDMLTRARDSVRFYEGRELKLYSLLFGDRDESSARHQHAVDLVSRYSAVVKPNEFPPELSEQLRAVSNELSVTA